MTEQKREHPVPCSICKRMTWNISGVCDDHDKAPT